MLKRLNLLLAFLLLFFLGTNAQKRKATIDSLLLLPPPQYLIEPHDSIANVSGRSYDLYVRGFLQRHFHDGLDTINIYGVCWTRFEIDENGSIFNIKCDPFVHPTLALFIKRMLGETQGQWNLNGPKSKFVRGSVIVLPIQYTLEYTNPAKPASPISIWELNKFLNDGEQRQVFYLPTVEYICATMDNFGGGRPKKTNENL